MARSVDELLVYRRAELADQALVMLVRQSVARCEYELANQLTSASVRIVSDIAEGFEQKTDRHFAHYLYQARGSANEVCKQLVLARNRGYITDNQRRQIGDLYVEIRKMLSGLIDYLEREDWKNRGQSRRRQRPLEANGGLPTDAE